MLKKERLEQDIKFALSKIISEEVKNPKIKGIISVTDVKITKDEKYAKVYVSVYNVQNKEEVMEGLSDADKFIRGRLAESVKMRNTPELTFCLDNSMEYGAYMDEKIKSLNITHDEEKEG